MTKKKNILWISGGIVALGVALLSLPSRSAAQQEQDDTSPTIKVQQLPRVQELKRIKIDGDRISQDVAAALAQAGDALAQVQNLGEPETQVTVFDSGEGPVIEKPLRAEQDVTRLRTDRGVELGYVSEAVRLVVRHFGDRLPVIGFCGAPFTLASYMIEGGGSRNYLHTKKMMYNSPAAWDELMRKLVAVLAEYAAEQVRAGADAIQIFDSWVGCLGVEDYRHYVLAHITELVRQVQKSGAPIIYFGTDTATLLPSMQETGAEVIGVDWRIPLDDAWRSLGYRGAVQGNLDPVLLFADWKDLKSRAQDILRRANGQPGHVFNLGHGILPETPVEKVRALAAFVQEYSVKFAPASR